MAEHKQVAIVVYQHGVKQKLLVDERISPLIEELYANGVYTDFSCSGEQPDGSINNGYISLNRNISVHQIGIANYLVTKFFPDKFIRIVIENRTIFHSRTIFGVGKPPAIELVFGVCIRWYDPAKSTIVPMKRGTLKNWLLRQKEVIKYQARKLW